MDNFVHLHNHSEYSLLDGACRIKDLAHAAAEAGQKAVAITDHGVMYGAVSFYNACKAEGVKPIIGCEVYTAPKSRFDRNRTGEDAYYHLVLLCKNEIGYKNLIYLVSCGFTEGFYVKPRIDTELLREHSEGLICLSGCLSGYIPRMLYHGEKERALEYAVTLRDIFGEDDFYIELQEHGIAAEEEILPQLCELAKEIGVGVVATNDVHYINKKDADTQKVLMCVQTNSSVLSDDIGFETNEFYFKPGNMMRNIFSFCPQACENTEKIADKCNFEFDFSNVYLPSFTPPPGFDSYTYLKKLTDDGLERRINAGQIPGGEEYDKRIEYELSVIHKMGFDDYYLIVGDYVGYAKSHGIETGPGRGSGAGSLVAYLIGITDIDPLKYGLMFERFLNPERVSMPDFDVDFADERRGEVISYVTEKYGRDRVSQIVTFNTLAARAAVRDCGRALGMSYASVDAVAKLIPNRLKITIKEALNEEKELRQMYDSDESVQKLIDTASAVEGMPRNISTHAAGVVITRDPVSSYVPLSTSGDMVLTQYDMDDISSLGLVKFDFLGIKYLTIIENTQRLIKSKFPEFDSDSIPIDDKETYKMISGGDTDGVFQLESEGMRRMLSQLQPSDIEDIIAAIALYRPGPMDSIPKYLKNRQDPSNIEYISPLLENTLSRTYGVVVYQEQVMEIFRILAGYSYGRADVVRRLMSKKKSELMQKQREIFLYGEKDEGGNTVIPGAVANGINEDDANRLFDELEGFAKYAFNKSHAACYAFVTYRTAYLKCHYYAEYMASLLTNELGNLAKTSLYISLCQKKGIPVLPPDINESGTQYTVVYDEGKPCIRYGLGAIKNVGVNFTQSVIEERKKRPFSDFCDFVSRMVRYDGNKKQMESLIKCGAFDSLGVYRSKLLASYDTIAENELSIARSNISGQIDIFSESADGDIKGEFKYPDIPEFSLKDRLMLEKEATGMYFSGHMLDEYSKNISAVKSTPISEIVSENSENEAESKRTVAVCGAIVSVTKKETKKGGVMAFAMLEDRYAQIEVLIFPKLLEQVSYLVIPDTAVMISGEISVKEGEEPKLLASSVLKLIPDSEYRPVKKNTAKTLYLSVPSKEDELCKKALLLLDIYEDEYGQTPYCIFCRDTGKYYKYNIKITLTQALLDRLKLLLGPEAVVYR